VIGLSPDQFWRSTLHELKGQVEAFNVNQERIDARVALICASIYNANRTKKDKLIKPEMFMPKKEKKDNKVTETQDMLRVAEQWTRVKGGIDRRGKQDDNIS